MVAATGHRSHRGDPRDRPPDFLGGHRGVAGQCRSELVAGESPIIVQLRRELDEYFKGARREFTVPLYAPGTPFQMKVWNELLRIPVGTTTTYSRVASAIGHPSAVRAVARASSKPVLKCRTTLINRGLQSVSLV